MFNQSLVQGKKIMVLAAILTSTILSSIAAPQSAPQEPGSTATTAPIKAGHASHYQASRFSKRASLYYGLVWGIDSPKVKYAESGELIRFSYHVLDPAKAKQLNDKKSAPSLIDPQAHVKLVVPQLEQVGLLRQSSPPEADKSYWMAFSNKGRPVKRGDRVTVVIGQFRADGLVVE